jgi:uncharacterized membrane protein YdjX (TVP38/TMEM64 family)
MHSSSLGSRESRSQSIASQVVLAMLAVVAVLALFWLVWNGEAVRAFKQEAGPFTFFAAMAVLPALGFPLTPFFVMAGATFGARIGLVGSVIALSLNLAICFWIARSGLRRILLALFARFNYEIPDFEREARGTLRFVALVKMAPGVPGFAKNYILGLVGVPFWTFFLCSLLFTGAYAAALTLLGESLGEHDLTRTLVSAVVLLVLAIGVWLWRKHRANVGAR